MKADIVIIGGGAMGTSIAFHLAEAGVPNVVLVERDQLGSGSTCKAAGGVRAQFSDEVNIRLGARSLEAFRRFRDRPGQEIDLHEVGYLFLLSAPEDVAAFERSVELQNELGVPSRMISPSAAAGLSPMISTDGLLAAAFSPTDGYCTPESVVLGYASAARRHGARILTGCRVTGIDDGVVRTTLGDIESPSVICTAGAWSEEIGRMAGVDLPVTPYRREIAITEPLPSVPARMPMTIDFSSSLYFHPEGPGMLIGITDPEDRPGFRMERSEDWLAHLADALAVRAPDLLDAGIASGWAGLYEVTPDHNALIGGEPRFMYATGFSGHGFLQAPAVGEVMRDLYLGQEPFVDISPFDARRFVQNRLRQEANVI